VNCSLAELDETTAGWIAQKSVGYCKSCADDIISKPKCQEETPHKKPRVESNDSSTGTSSDESDSADSLLNQRQSTPKNSTKKRREKEKKKKLLAERLCGKKQILMI
jgi:hypothetical protein